MIPVEFYVFLAFPQLKEKKNCIYVNAVGWYLVVGIDTNVYKLLKIFLDRFNNDNGNVFTNGCMLNEEGN